MLKNGRGHKSALAAEAGPALAAGVDFGVIGNDGRLDPITGFLDQMPQAAGA